jgi:UDP-N-acetylmuramoyl-L-alanyl-D-glutamate--2,6-diaminopimelate ligase
MRLDVLLHGLGPLVGAEPIGVAGTEPTGVAGTEPRGVVDVSGVAVDSRRVRPGDVFFALAGARDDGAQHVADAVRRGARAIVAEHPIPAPPGVPVIVSPQARAVLAHAAARAAGDPSRGLVLVGVTGTNGKTTTTWLLDGIWRAAGARTGLVGTIAYQVGDQTRPAPLTTPDAVTLAELLAEMRDAGVSHVTMEASSHALAQRRVDGLAFDAAVFTNLTRDHLDYHDSLDDYFASKARLFHELLPAGGKAGATAVVHTRDEFGERLAREVGSRCVTVGRAAGSMVRLRDEESTIGGTRGVLELDGRPLPFRSPLVGAPHGENIAVAAATAWALGVPAATIAAGIAATPAPPGRVERIDGDGFTVVVDYAHTPDALGRLLEALRPLVAGTLVTVFGCGGDRDPGKRPLMGMEAARWSDVVIVTSDNPRTEDPAAIVAAIEPGVRATLPPLADGARRGYVLELDRRRAIGRAIGLARPGDLVVIAGKGHEDYQILGTEKHHLDDREEVRRALGALGS